MNETEQKSICQKHGSAFVHADPELKLGIAIQTLHLEPIYGTRMKIEHGTNGWYIHAGADSYTSDVDFYQPLCTKHIEEYCPIISRYLGLEPGYRFIIDRNGYEDVWKDKTLLEPDASANGDKRRGRARR